LSVAGLARTLRWALVNSAEARARRRAEQLARTAAGGAEAEARQV
jgi:hypothetical protein